MVISVSELDALPFQNRTVEERIQIVLDGKPRPIIIPFAESSDQLGAQHFDVNIYDRVPWLTACDRTCFFFCWPCLLYNRPGKGILCTVSCGSNLASEIVEEHEKHDMHKLSVLSLDKFEKENAEKLTPKPSGKRYRKVYQKNQDILRLLIDIVCEMAQTAPLLKVCETQNRISPDSCVEYLQLLRKSSDRRGKLASEGIDWVKRHPKLLDDIVEAMKKVLEARVKQEMESSTYVSLILSEHSTESSSSQLSLVARYIKEGKVQERLLGFLSILVDKTAEVVCKILFAMLDRFRLNAKFLSCSLDGAVLDTYQLTEFKKLMGVRFPRFYLVPCYAHGLYYILLQSLSAGKEAGPFFKLLVAMGTFFDRKSQHWTALTSLLLRKAPELRHTQNWQDLPLVTLIHRYRLIFIEHLDSVSQSCNIWDSGDVVSAMGFLHFLKEFQTIFLLHVVSAVFRRFAFLNEAMRGPEPQFAFDKMSEIPDHLSPKPDFEDFWRGALKAVDERTQELYLEKRGELKELFNGVINRVYEEIRIRFFHLGYLKFCCLLRKEYYVPDDQMQNSHKKDLSYYFSLMQRLNGNQAEIDQLQSEMHVLRDSGELLEGKDLYSVLETLSDGKYRKIFVQFLKLLEYTFTMAFKKPSTDRECLKLERIKGLRVDSMLPTGEISVLVIQADLLQRLRSDDVWFYKDAISHFSESNKYIELVDDKV